MSSGEFRVRKSEFRVEKGEFRVRKGEFRVRKGEFRVEKSVFRVRIGEFRVEKCEFRVRKGDLQQKCMLGLPDSGLHSTSYSYLLVETQPMLLFPLLPSSLSRPSVTLMINAPEPWQL